MRLFSDPIAFGPFRVCDRQILLRVRRGDEHGQVDFNLPEKFDLIYRDVSGNDVRPIMIHRALLGSVERFFGILVEHFKGAFLLWLAPEQVTILTIADRHIPYAEKISRALEDSGLRVATDF